MDPGENDGIHPDPALLTDNNVFSRQMSVYVQRVMITCDYADIWGDKAAFADKDMGICALKIDAEALKVVQVI